MDMNWDMIIGISSMIITLAQSVTNHEDIPLPFEKDRFRISVIEVYSIIIKDHVKDENRSEL